MHRLRAGTLLAVFALSACSGGAVPTPSVPSATAFSASVAASTASPTAAPPTTRPSPTVVPISTAAALGRILILRFPEPGPAEYLTVIGRIGRTAFRTASRVETRQVSPDESLLAMVGRTARE